ncbi:MAG: threonine/serine dehydratase [Candidatus Lokiarchaeia archaeon]|nr:threonine/serine dehydratase [Candidatus Lokiarchaeia archaeon]
MSYEGIQNAYKRIKSHINKTPVMTSSTLDSITNAKIYFKCENFQKVGAFKFRGAFNAISLLTDEQWKQGVITHSSGNHAQALALAATKLGIHATIVMPKGAPKNKINATKGYGAEIEFCENSLEARIRKTEEIIKKRRSILIHPFDNDNIINGQGTAAYELFEEIGELDIIIAPLGGGGLLSGTAIAPKGLFPNTQVIGVEPELADDALRSLEAGYIIPSIYPDTIADGLRTSLCERTFHIIQKYVDNVVTVSEIEIIEAMRFLWERMKMIVEPSGAVPLAALLSKKISIENKKIGAILSGGNIDIEPFFQLLKKKINKL